MTKHKLSEDGKFVITDTDTNNILNDLCTHLQLDKNSVVNSDKILLKDVKDALLLYANTEDVIREAYNKLSETLLEAEKFLQSKTKNGELQELDADAFHSIFKKNENEIARVKDFYKKNGTEYTENDHPHF